MFTPCHPFASRAENGVALEWSPDGQKVLISTTAPRLRVDNGIRVVRADAKLLAQKAYPLLLQAAWRPVPPGTFQDKALDIPKDQADGQAAPAVPEAPPAPTGYVPPHLRNNPAVAAAARAKFSLARDENDRGGKIVSGVKAAATPAAPVKPVRVIPGLPPEGECGAGTHLAVQPPSAVMFCVFDITLLHQHPRGQAQGAQEGQAENQGEAGTGGCGKPEHSINSRCMLSHEGPMSNFADERHTHRSTRRGGTTLVEAKQTTPAQWLFNHSPHNVQQVDGMARRVVPRCTAVDRGPPDGGGAWIRTNSLPPASSSQSQTPCHIQPMHNDTNGRD